MKRYCVCVPPPQVTEQLSKGVQLETAQLTGGNEQAADIVNLSGQLNKALRQDTNAVSVEELPTAALELKHVVAVEADELDMPAVDAELQYDFPPSELTPTSNVEPFVDWISKLVRIAFVPGLPLHVELMTWAVVLAGTDWV
jgi:hypothetical protein